MDLAELRERLEKASGPDREIDALIALAWQEPNEHYKQPLRYPILLPPENQRPGILERVEISGVSVYSAPKVTGSLDAIVSLIERKLPGLLTGFRTVGVWAPDHHWAGKPVCEAMLMDVGDCDSAEPFCPPEDRDEDEVCEFEAKHCTPALALCLAFVKAMEAQSNEPASERVTGGSDRE